MPQDSPPVYSGCVLQYQGFRLGVQFRLCILYLTRPLPEGLKDLVGSVPGLSLQFCFGDVLLKVWRECLEILSPSLGKDIEAWGGCLQWSLLCPVPYFLVHLFRSERQLDLNCVVCFLCGAWKLLLLSL